MLDEIKSEPVWSSYLDPEDETTVLFYNRVTKESVREKPVDYDGHYVIGEAAAQQRPGGKEDTVAKKIYERTFGDMSKMFCTPLEQAAEETIVIEKFSGAGLADTTTMAAAAVNQECGILLGGWEEVKEEDQFDVINRAHSEDSDVKQDRINLDNQEKDKEGTEAAES